MASAAGSTPPSIDPKALQSLYENSGALGKDDVKDVVKGTGLVSSHSLETLGDELQHQNPTPVSEKHTFSNVQDLSKLSTTDKAKEKFYSVLTKISNLWSNFVSKFTSSHDKNYVIDLHDIAEEAEKLGEVINPPPSTAQEDAPVTNKETAPSESKPAVADRFAAMQARRNPEKEKDIREFLRTFASQASEAAWKAKEAAKNANPEFKAKLENAAKHLEESLEDAQNYTQGINTEQSDADGMKATIKSQIENLKNLALDSRIAIQEGRGERIKQMKGFANTLDAVNSQLRSKVDSFYERANNFKLKSQVDNTYPQFRIIDEARVGVREAVNRAQDQRLKYEKGEISFINEEELLNDIDAHMNKLNQEIATADKYFKSLPK